MAVEKFYFDMWSIVELMVRFWHNCYFNFWYYIWKKKWCM